MPNKVGKPVGSDLRQGTVTLPVFYYLQTHPEAVAGAADHGQRPRNGDLLGQLIADIAQSPAIDATRQEADPVHRDRQGLPGVVAGQPLSPGACWTWPTM